MKVRCKATSLTEEQHRYFHLGAHCNPTYPDLEVGQDYLVFGISSFGDPLRPATAVQVEIAPEMLVPVPVVLFDVVDDRASKYWRVRKLTEYTLALWPTEFYRDYFHDDLSEGVAEAVETFYRVKRLLEAEFAEPPSNGER